MAKTKKGRISMTTADGCFIFTPDRIIKGNYKYVVIRIYHNPTRSDTDFYLKDNFSNLSPLPKCDYVDNYVSTYKRQFDYAINQLNNIHNNNPDAFWRFDLKKKRNVIDTIRLTNLVYGDKAISKARNGIEYLPITIDVSGEVIDTVSEVNITSTKTVAVDSLPFEKSKINQAKKINKYFGKENSPKNIIDEINNRVQIEKLKAVAVDRSNKYGEYSKIIDKKIINKIISEGEFNQDDLYLYATALTSVEKNADKYNVILHRLREYNLRNNTTLTVSKDLSVEGIEKFVKFFVEHGINEFNTIGITPFNYRTEKFLKRLNEKKGFEKTPTDETWRKFFIYLRLLLNLFDDDKKLLSSKGWKEDGRQKDKQVKELADASCYGINFSSLSTNTRQSYHLTKSEFDKIFKQNLKSSKQTKVNAKTGHKYHIGFDKEDLTLTRDMFVLMCWGGGLRPIEYNPERCHILKDSKGEYYFNYVTSEKNKKEISNPIVNYSFDVLKKYNFKLPFQKLKSDDFSQRLREILIQCGINRDIIKLESRSGVDTRIKLNIQDAVYPYFARHTFVQILDDAGLSREQIAMFTGHGVPNLSIDAYSSKKLSVKKNLIKGIKFKG